MGLNIYFLDESGDDVEIESNLRITHNLNKILIELDNTIRTNYYELIWRPDEFFNCENGKVEVEAVLTYLPNLISNLVFYQYRLEEHLPENGYGSFEWLYKFLCAYLKECCLHQDKYIYCCR